MTVGHMDMTTVNRSEVIDATDVHACVLFKKIVVLINIESSIIIRCASYYTSHLELSSEFPDACMVYPKCRQD